MSARRLPPAADLAAADLAGSALAGDAGAPGHDAPGHDAPGRPGPGNREVPAPAQERAPIPLLFLIGDTGGGHRSAAQAVSQALELAHPGRFAPVIHDPLLSAASPWLSRRIIGLYGPTIRLTPWLWGVIWRGSATPAGLAFWRMTLFKPANEIIAGAVAAHRPAAIVSFHPMTARPAVMARSLAAPGAPVVTVITDLITTHPSWRDAGVDRIVAPSPAVAGRCRLDGIPAARCAQLGLPVGTEFARPPLSPPQREALRRSMELPARRFLVVMTGGAEGSGRMFRRAAAILRRFEDVQVAVVCGRNRLLRRRLDRLAARSGGRLTVLGFVGNMADWLRCADVVVAKAGPQTIAEAACCAAPLLLTSSVPGQERGNTEFVVEAGAGRHAPTVRRLLREIGELRRAPEALAAMRSAATRLSRPDAAADIADLLAGLAAAPDSAAAAGSVAAGSAGAGQPVAWSQRTGAPSAAHRNGSSSSSQGCPSSLASSASSAVARSGPSLGPTE